MQTERRQVLARKQEQRVSAPVASKDGHWRTYATSTHPDPGVPVSQLGKGTGHLGVAIGSLEESESENPILCRIAALRRSIVFVSGVLQSDIRRDGDTPLLEGRNNRLAEALDLRVFVRRVEALIHPSAFIVSVVKILAQLLSQVDDF